MDGEGADDGDTGPQPSADRDGVLYRRLIEYSTDLISVLDTDGTIRFTSPSSAQVLGYEAAELLGENALEMVHPEDRDRVQEAFEDIVTRPREADHVEYRYRSATGEWVWLETRGQNRLDDDVLGGIVVVSRDVTDRHRREHALETLHDRTREMLTAESREAVAGLAAETAGEVLDLPVTVVRLLAPDGKRLEPVAVTETAEAVLGERPVYEVGEGTAGTAFEREEPLAYDDLQTIEDGYSRGEARAGLFVPIGDHGVLSIGDTDRGALDQEDVQLARILAGNIEVALDRLEREEEFKRQNERLEEFASVISHDLRSPLNVATGRLDLLEADPERVEPIESALTRMEELIENVLALARKGRAVDDTRPVALSEVVDRCWRNVATGRANVEVTTDRIIRADPGRVPELFENLFRNAVEHGGEGVTITVGELDDGFFVADDGPGIPAEHRDRIFESGFSTTRAGTGFGLAIVEQIAEAHGWRVKATESASGGARFEFTGVHVAEGE